MRGYATPVWTFTNRFFYVIIVPIKLLYLICYLLGYNIIFSFIHYESQILNLRKTNEQHPQTSHPWLYSIYSWGSGALPSRRHLPFKLRFQGYKLISSLFEATRSVWRNLKRFGVTKMAVGLYYCECIGVIYCFYMYVWDINNNWQKEESTKRKTWYDI